MMREKEHKKAESRRKKTIKTRNEKWKKGDEMQEQSRRKRRCRG